MCSRTPAAECGCGVVTMTTRLGHVTLNSLLLETVDGGTAAVLALSLCGVAAAAAAAAAEMAAFPGRREKRNPVFTSFERDVQSFMTLMKRVSSSAERHDSTDLYTRGIKSLMEIWGKYKHRLPLKLYQEQMLQVADFLYEIKLYHVALWQGYSVHLLQYNAVSITDITSVEHFLACFFPGGLDADRHELSMKIRAMHGSAMCVFEMEKRHTVLTQERLCKVLRVLDVIRIMMQVFQQHEHLSWQIYNGSLNIYTICRFLMTKNCSAQALEYLLWASISLELSIPLMTVKNIPWIVTLYCAVCHCYYDVQASVQGEEFAKRALNKISEVAKLEEQHEVSASRENQRAFKEASIKLGAMVFKRTVYEARRKPKAVVKTKIKTNLKDTPYVSWPRTATEHALVALFDSSAAQFLAILEALWYSTTQPLTTRMPDDPEVQEVIQELLSAGIVLLSGALTSTDRSSDDQSILCLSATSTLIDLAIAGEDKISIVAAVRFMKLLFQYKKLEEFTDLVRGVLQVLAVVEGRSFRKAENELALLDAFNTLLSAQRSHSTAHDKSKFLPPLRDELNCLTETLHKSVCDSAPGSQPDVDLVLDVVLFLWGKAKAVLRKDNTQYPEFAVCLNRMEKYDKWLWCLSRVCDMALACDLATVDCTTVTEMIHTLVIWLERAADHRHRARHRAPGAAADGDSSSFYLLECSSSELLRKVCELTRGGLHALAKGVAAAPPQDFSAIMDSAFIQKFCPRPPSTPASSTVTASDEGNDEDGETMTETDPKGSGKKKSTCTSLPAVDFHLELDIIHHRAAAKLLQLNEVEESELMDHIKKNKASTAVFLTQKALLLHNGTETNEGQVKSLLEDAMSLMERAALEEKRLYFSTICKIPPENKVKEMKKGEDNPPPPPPILLSRTDHCFTFAPAPYSLEDQVGWYQLWGRVADGLNHKVRLGDCTLPGTGLMVQAGCGQCVLRADGLVYNQKYVFAVAAYNREGRLLGNSIGQTTFPMLASMPVPLLSTWAHLAEVAFQTEQYAIAKRACRELWSHYTTCAAEGPEGSHDKLPIYRLDKATLQHSSTHMCQLFLTSIFIETEINIHQGALYYDSFGDNGPFIWEQEARLEESARMVVAMNLALHLKDSVGAVQAVVSCYGLLTPLIFHQIPCKPVVQVLNKCLTVLEANSVFLKQKWNGTISESLMHMIACITFCVSKLSRVLGEHQTPSTTLDCGRRLLQDILDAHLQIIREPIIDPALAKREKEISLQLKALNVRTKKRIRSEPARPKDKAIQRPLTGSEDPAVLYDMIFSSTLKDAYDVVVELRCTPVFIEHAALLLQRTEEEGHPDLVVKWGQSIFEFLSRRDDVLMKSKKDHQRHSERKTHFEIDEPKENTPSANDTGKKVKKVTRVMLHSLLVTNRETVKKLLSMMASFVRRRKKQRQLTERFSEESLWKSHLNFSVAQAHMTLLYQDLSRLNGGDHQHRYSQINPLFFSLGHSGLLVPRNSQQPSPKHELVPGGDSPNSALQNHVDVHENGLEKDAVGGDDSVTEGSLVKGNGASKSEEEEHIERNSPTLSVLLDSLNKAATHFQRAMVLSYRGSHWTTLQFVCQAVWDHNCRIHTVLHRHPHSHLTTEHLHATFTRLLCTATDLIMDMMDKLGLWRLFDRDWTEEQEYSLCFLAPLDDTTRVDLRWVRTLVLHTLQQLHECGKWECLAHFALLFNSYTREQYALVIIPLLVHAQRKLQERIRDFRGPAFPQPHHLKTQHVTGKKVTYKNYASCQLLIAFKKPRAQRLHTHKLTNPVPEDTDELKEKQRSMSLVCVPLDVEDTLTCYHQAVERRPLCLQVFHRSRSLLLQLLANTQPCFAARLQQCPPTGLPDCSLALTPNVHPLDLTHKNNSSPNGLHSLRVDSDFIPTITAAYNSSIKYLQANGHDSLTVQSMHEVGNLHFYNGNTRGAHSCWSKAVDVALHCSGTVEKWDRLSFGNGSMQQTLKQAGMWGCLQAAGLTAKIAQYILTTNINQQVKCCLLSAYLFKCVLCCSLAQPHADLLYASHSIGAELLPGVDFFSDPHRVHLGTTVSGLSFICHWLFSAGYWIKLLPVLALYLHFVGTLCKDVQRYVEGKILKIRALAELRLFTEAVAEAVHLTRATDVPLPHGHHLPTEDLQPLTTFCTNKCLLDNAEALEELVKCDFAPAVRTLYGPTLCLRYRLARVQLLLTLAQSEHRSPEAGQVSENITNGLVDSEERDQEKVETECLSPPTEQPKVLDPSIKTHVTAEMIKSLLLEAASNCLNSVSEELTTLCCSEMEKLELTIESQLLKSDLYLQQGELALSSEMAASCMTLLQTSPVITRKSLSDSEKPEGETLQPNSEQCTKDGVGSNLVHEDSPGAVEAGERVGIYMWLRCRVALVCSTVALCGTAAVIPGKNINDEAAQLLQEGLDECAQWEDLDTQALLLLEAAELKSQRGDADESAAALQDAVSLLSDQACLSPKSSLTLTRATLLLGDPKTEQCTNFLQLTQKLVKKQLSVFDENVILEDGKVSFSSPGPRNIYLPYLSILDRATLKMGQIQDLSTMEMTSASPSLQSSLKHRSHPSSSLKRDAKVAVSPLSKISTAGPMKPTKSAR